MLFSPKLSQSCTQRETETIHTCLCPYGRFHIIQFSVQLKRATEKVRERERDKSQQQSPPDAFYFKVQILEY